MPKRIAIVKASVLGGCVVGALYFSLVHASTGTSPSSPPTGPRPRAEARPDVIVCSGRVEPVDGEVDVSAQVAGQLAEVRAREGDEVKQGDILAVLDGPRQAAELAVAEASVALAAAKLRHLEAGNGREEIQQAHSETESIEALLAYEAKSLERSRRLFATSAISADDYDRQRQRVEQLKHQRDGLCKHHEALKRGSRPEEIQVARTELALAEARAHRVRVERELLLVRAPMNGKVLEVYRHQGDSVSLDRPSPIVRMADTSRLRIRLEVDEANVARLRPGQSGTFQIRGVAADAGRLSLTAILPVFGPKRLFNPDTSARVDTRILSVLCQPTDNLVPLYPGQRVSATLVVGTTIARAWSPRLGPAKEGWIK
jgi:multidrug efflux pump subunit AcrA (membrane-fusion protein)